MNVLDIIHGLKSFSKEFSIKRVNKTNNNQIPSSSTSLINREIELKRALGDITIKTSLIIEAQFDLRLLSKLDQLSFIKESLPTSLCTALTRWSEAQKVWVYTPLIESSREAKLPSINEVWLQDKPIPYNNHLQYKNELLIWQQSYTSCIQQLLNNNIQNYYLIPTVHKASLSDDRNTSQRRIRLSHMTVAFHRISPVQPNIAELDQTDSTVYICITTDMPNKLFQKLESLDITALIMEDDEAIVSASDRSSLTSRRHSTAGMIDQVNKGKSVVIYGQYNIALFSDLLLQEYIAHTSVAVSKGDPFYLPKIVSQRPFRHARSESLNPIKIDFRSKFTASDTLISSQDAPSTSVASQVDMAKPITAKGKSITAKDKHTHKIIYEGVFYMSTLPTLLHCLHQLARYSQQLSTSASLSGDVSHVLLAGKRPIGHNYDPSAPTFLVPVPPLKLRRITDQEQARLTAPTALIPNLMKPAGSSSRPSIKAPATYVTHKAGSYDTGAPADPAPEANKENVRRPNHLNTTSTTSSSSYRILFEHNDASTTDPFAYTTTLSSLLASSTLLPILTLEAYDSRVKTSEILRQAAGVPSLTGTSYICSEVTCHDCLSGELGDGATTDTTTITDTANHDVLVYNTDDSNSAVDKDQNKIVYNGCTFKTRLPKPIMLIKSTSSEPV